MNSASTTVPTDLTNERLPSGRLLALGLQHVLVMYAGTVAVPLIVGGALKLPKDQLAFLINADLFAAGLATLIQAIGFWKFGIRMPVMMGVTFASVAPMIAIGNDPNVGLLGIYGAVIAAGERHPQRVENEIGAHVGGELPAHDAAAVDVEDEAEEHHAFPAAQIGAVRDPEAIRA